MSGVAGVRTAGPSGPCNHFEGALQGSILSAGPIPGARIQATYVGDITGATCPSPSVPAGGVGMLINGVVVAPCNSTIGFPKPTEFDDPDARTTSTTAQ
jgi:hypothetical protein